MTTVIEVLVNRYPKRAWVPGNHFVIKNASGVIQGTMAPITTGGDGDQLFNFAARMLATAANWEAHASVWIASGTYTLYAIGKKDTDAGIVSWYVDNVLVASSQDWYNGSLVRNFKVTMPSVAIVGNGKHHIKVLVTGKNASSSNFRVYLSSVWLVQAND